MSLPVAALTALIELVIIPLGLGVVFIFTLWLLLPRGRRHAKFPPPHRPPKPEP